MVRETLRQAAALIAIGAMLGCGSDGPVGPSGSTTTTSVAATTSTTTITPTTTTTTPTTSTTVPATSTPTTSTTTTSLPIVTTSTTSTTTSIPIIITTTSTTTIPIITIITTSTTTTIGTNFSAVFANMNTCTNAVCHGGGFPAGDSRNFTTQLQAYNFAIARSSNNNANSLFLTKPSQTNGQSHSGGTVWPANGAAYNTALAWINSGRGM